MRIRIWPTVRETSLKSTRTGVETAGIVVLAVLLLAGFIYSVVVPPVANFTDEYEYLKLSENLVRGPGFSLDGSHLTASRPPGYAFFLAAIRSAGGGFVSFRVVQFLLLGATLLLVSRLCTERQPFAELLVVTMLVICYPVLFYTAATLYPQTLAGFLFVLALWLTLRTPRTALLNALAGVVFGVLVLVVPTFLFTLVVALVAARFLQIIRWRNVVVTILAAGIVVGAWTLRNAACFDRFVPIATNSGLNFLEGNNEKATPLAAANVGMDAFYFEADQQGLDEFQRDAFYRKAAFTWIETHPGDALVLYLGKVANFFNIVNVYSPQSQAHVSPWKQGVLAAGYLLLLGLLGWRLTSTRHYPLASREKLFLVVYVLSAFTSAIFFTRIRHRLPYDYLIIAIVASYLSRRLSAGFDRQPTAALAPAPRNP